MYQLPLPNVADEIAVEPDEIAVKEPVVVVRPMSDRFSPRKEDNLFWSIYIATVGVPEFMAIGHRYHNFELEEKQKMIAAFQKSSAPLKRTNIKISNVRIQEILADLMINKKTNLQTIIAFSVYYDITIYLVNEETRVYLKYIPEMETKRETIIIYKTSTNNVTNHNYSVCTATSVDKLAKITRIEETMVQLEHGDKYFRGISYYKMEDLDQIADKLGIEMPDKKKVKKADLYAKIVEKGLM
jgi:hypothetical protein